MRDIRSGFYTKAPVRSVYVLPYWCGRVGDTGKRVEAFFVELETTKRSPHSTLVGHSKGVSLVFKFFWNPQLCAKQPNLKEISQRVASPYINSFFFKSIISLIIRKEHTSICAEHATIGTEHP